MIVKKCKTLTRRGVGDTYMYVCCICSYTKNIVGPNQTPRLGSASGQVLQYLLLHKVCFRR